MRSRSLPETLLLAFGAIADGIWCGALAATLVGASGPKLMIFAVTVVFAAALLAGWAGRDAGRTAPALVLAVALTLGAAGALVVAGHTWDAASPVPSIAAEVSYAALLALAGVGLGRTPLAPNAATRRGIRAFVLLCLVLVAATLAGSAPWWATYALAATLVASGLLVAAAGYEAVAALVPAAERTPAWAWLLAVLGVTLLVVSASVLLSGLLRVDLLLWALTTAGAALRYVAEALAYAVAFVGAGLIRAATALLGLFHVHGLKQPKPPEAPAFPKVVVSARPGHTGEWRLSRFFVTAVAALVAIGVPLALVALALRHVRRDQPGEVAEERETVLSLRSAAAAGIGRLAGSVRGLVSRPAPPRTPAELLRRRYVELEHRLRRQGHERAPAATVRAFLQGVSAATSASAATTATASAATDTARELAGLYEAARYSSAPLDWSAASRFETLAAVFTAAVAPS